jgi:hypothetical protein
MSRYTCISYLLVSRCPLICVERLLERICLVRLLQFYALQDTNELSCLEQVLWCDFLPRLLAVGCFYSDNSNHEPPSDLWIKYLSTLSVEHRFNIEQNLPVKQGKIRLHDRNHVRYVSGKMGTDYGLIKIDSAATCVELLHVICIHNILNEFVGL